MIGIAVYTAVTGEDPVGDGRRASPTTSSGDRAPASTTSTAPLPPIRRVGSTEVEPATPVVVGVGPDTYEVTYRVRLAGQRDATETIVVERPYRSRRTSPTERTATDFARLQVLPSSGAGSVLSPPPASVDPRPGLVVDRAVEEGLLEPREHRRVLGRTCRVYRTLRPVTSSTISAALPNQHTDICVDEAGLVLEEWQVNDGRAVQQRLATAIGAGGPVIPVTDAPTLTATQGGGSVLAADPSSEPPGRFFVLDAPPAGFTLRGRYSVIPPQPGLTDEQERRKAVASTVDVYERGADVLVVDRGGTLNFEPAFQPRPEGREVDLGPVLGVGELLLSWNGPEVRVGLADGKFVRVHGTVPVDVVVATARALRETTGGSGLVFTGR